MIAALAGLFSFIGSSSVQAQTDAVEFLNALRSRGFYDTALEYLDGLQASGSVPVALAEVIDLERGITQQVAGATSRVVADRELQLNNAEASLRKFLNEHSGHERAADANSLLGQLLLDRASTALTKAEAAETPEEVSELQGRARTLTEQAEKIFQAAHDQYQAAYKEYKVFIDQNREEELYEQKQRAEGRYINAWFSLCECFYKRGLTYPMGSPDRKLVLDDAAARFEALSKSQFSRTVRAYHARVMMGKCFQEQGDLGRALGIYQDPANQEAPQLAEVRGYAVQYTLMCQNDPSRANYEVVTRLATDWLTQFRNLATSPFGVGILYQRAFAQEKRAEAPGIESTQRESYLRAALDDATVVGRYDGPFQDVANLMVRRIKSQLGDQDAEPKDFETAFERAYALI
ncbi:MAG: hypothetical protein KDA96_06215, partial [Planctomycetaceae bacterium]|nr:hypothetical protein [Planctomycetaceae bacterium]